MKFIPDNSSNGFDLIANGNSKPVEGVQEKKVSFKSQVQPSAPFANRTRSRFGEVVDIAGDVLVAGAPAFIQNATNSGSDTNAGGVWIFEKVAKSRAKSKFKTTRRKQVFNATGEIQQFTVPENVSRLVIQMIAAGGGGNTLGTFNGGDGAYVKADIAVEPGKTYDVIVGKGGIAGGQTNAFGGGGRLTAANGKGGSGGGRSAFADPALGDLLTAGAGGGAGVDGPGGFGGLKGGSGVSRGAGGALEPKIAAKGADGYMIGSNASDVELLYSITEGGAGTHGSTYLWSTKVAGLTDSNLNYINDNRTSGDNASPTTRTVGDFENGAGGGGFSGGAAGPDSYAYRATTSVSYSYLKTGGSGSGGSSWVEPTLATVYRTSTEMVRDVVTFDGGSYQLAAEFDNYGRGGNASEAGQDGVVVIEWEEVVADIETTVDASDWNETAMLIQVAPDRNAQALFGASVSTDGTWVVIGAPGSQLDSGNINSLTGAGAVFVYKKVENVWTQVQKITPTGSNARNANDAFGTAVKLIGTRLYVGAPNNSFDATGVNQVVGAGVVFVFDLIEGVWTQVNRISAGGVNSRIAADMFGYVLASDGPTLVVSSKNGYDKTGSTLTAGAGTAWVFNTTDFEQVARLSGPAIANARFGSSLSVKGETLAVGCSGASSDYIYKRVGGVWETQATRTDGAGNLIASCSFKQSSLSHTSTYTGKNISLNKQFMGAGLSAGTLGDLYQYRDTSLGHGFASGATVFAQYDNSGIAVNAPAIINKPEFTISQFIYVMSPTTFVGDENINSLMPMFRRGTNWGFFLRRTGSETSGGELLFIVNNKKYSFGKLQLQRWIQMAMSYDGLTLKVFVNGELRNSYDVSQEVFADSDTPLSWGFNSDINDASPPKVAFGEFYAYDKAIYTSHFTAPTSLYSVTVGDAPTNPSTFGRGTSTLVLDEKTILTGLPTSYTSEVLVHPELHADSPETFHTENMFKNTGQVEITQFDGEEWKNLVSPIVDAGGSYDRFRWASGSYFGYSLFVDSKYLYVHSSDRYTHSGEYVLAGYGSVWVYDVNNNFSFVKKVLPTDRGVTDARFGFRLINGAKSFAATEDNYRNRNSLMLEAQYALPTSNTRYEPFAIKKTFSIDHQGRRVDVRVDEFGLAYTKQITIKKQPIGAAGYAKTFYNTPEQTTTAGRFTFDAVPNLLSDIGSLTNGFTLDSVGNLYFGKLNGIPTTENGMTSSNTGTVLGFTNDSATDNYNHAEAVKYFGYYGQNTTTNDMFGHSVKSDGTRVYVGIPGSGMQETGYSGSSRGAVHIYKYYPERKGFDVEQGILNPVASSSQWFGFGIDVSADSKFLLARSAPASNAQAYLYELTENGYTLKQSTPVDRADGETGEGKILSTAKFFGNTNNAVIGATRYSPTGKTNIGTAHPLMWDETAMQFKPDVVRLLPSSLNDSRISGAEFGYAMKIVGNNLFVGAPGYGLTQNETNNRGTVGSGFLWKLNADGLWDYDHVFNSTSASTSGRYGSIIEVKGNTVLMMSKTVNNSRALVFHNTSGTFTHTSDVVLGTNQQSYNIAMIDETHFVMGQQNTGPNSGTRHIVTGNFVDISLGQTSWQIGAQSFVPMITNGSLESGSVKYGFDNTHLSRNAADNFGSAVAFNSDKTMLLIGAPGHAYRVNPSAGSAGTNIGALFAYYLDTETNKWRLNTKVSNNSLNANDMYGSMIQTQGNEFILGSNGSSNRGMVTRIKYDTTGLNAAWSQTYMVQGASSSQLFGSSVAFDATRNLYLVGSEAGTVSGNASGFLETVTTAGSKTSYSAPVSLRSRAASSQFGYSVSVNNGMLAVGGPGYSYNNAGNVNVGAKGLVYVYDIGPYGTWRAIQKITFEDQGINGHGRFVGLSDGALHIHNVNAVPQVLLKDINGQFTTKATINAPADQSFSAIPRQVGWDRETGNAVLVRTSNSGAIEVPNASTNFGIAVPMTWDGASLSVHTDKTFSAAIVGATNIVEPPHDISSTSVDYGFAQSGMAFSPDGQMLAIAAHNDIDSLSDSGKNQTYPSTGTIRGKIFVYQKNTETGKFVYHSMIVFPVSNYYNAGADQANVYWNGDILSVRENKYLFNFEYVDNKFWKLTSHTTFEGSTSGNNAVLAHDGNTLVMSRPNSYGYPRLTQSGALRSQFFKDGILISSRGIHAGANAEPYGGNTRTAGGGGAGAIGGKAAGFNNAYGVAMGGSNLLPEGAVEFLSPGTERANKSHPRATGAGGYNAKAPGEDARIIITADGVDTEFNYNGFDQPYVVPEGVTEISFIMWGAGGGSAANSSEWTRLNQGRGGAGACVSGSLTVVPGETLMLMVGGGGAGGLLYADDASQRENTRYGLGGIGSIALDSTEVGGGGGGGLAGIKRGDNFIAIAGGGGGGGNNTSAGTRQNGGPGGYPVDQDYTQADNNTSDADFVVAPGIVNSRISGDTFGYAVKIANDDLVLVGSPAHRYDVYGDRLPASAGAVFSYKRVNGRWEIVTKIISAVPTPREYFGIGFANDGDRVVVLGGDRNTFNESVGGMATSLRASSLEVFEQDGRDLTSVAKRNFTDTKQSSLSIALVNGLIVAGMPGLDKSETSLELTSSGGFGTYSIDEPTITLQGLTTGVGVSHGRFGGDLFGSSVELTNSQLLVGAPGHNYTMNGANLRTNQGAIYVFDKRGTSFTFRDKINLELSSTETGYGKTLKLVGDKLYAGTNNAAHVVELSQANGAWTISKHIQAGANKIAEVMSTTKLMELDPTASIGVGSQQPLTDAGRAKAFTIGANGTLVDANEEYSIPGKSSGRNINDNFGYSVYAGNDFVVVGAPNHAFDENGVATAKSGALFVFNKSGDKWVNEKKIVADTTAPVGFGRAIAGREGWIITSGLNNSTGFARIMQRTAVGKWETRKDFTGTGLLDDAFGRSVTMSDTSKYVVGVPGKDSDLLNTGETHAYERIGTNWFDRGTNTTQGLAKGRNAGDWFGYHVAANKNFIVIGSPKYAYDAIGTNELDDAGAVWIYLKNSRYSMVGKYVSPTRTELGMFGNAVGIDQKSNRIAVGEPGTNSVHVFNFDGDALTLEQTLTAELGEGEIFGTTLAYNANMITVGSAKASTDALGENVLVDAGAAYVFVRDNSNGTWSLKEKIVGFTDADNALMLNGREEGDLFGTAVAMDAKGSLIIGAPGHNWDIDGANELEDSGAVFLKKLKK